MTKSASSRLPDATDAWVGARIALRRSALAMSQSDLARRIGVSFQQLQKYENGSNRISASRLHRIALALGAPAGEFFPPDRPDVVTPELGVMRFMTATREGRAVAEAFPLIADRRCRAAVARIVRALAQH